MLKNQCIGHRAPDGRNWAASSGALFCFVICFSSGSLSKQSLIVPYIRLRDGRVALLGE